MARIQECILYRDFQHGEILQKMTMLMCVYEEQQSKLTEKENYFMSVPMVLWKLRAPTDFQEPLA